MATVIVTDSSAHIPDDLLKEHGITVVPFHIHFEGEDFLEGEKYTHLEFYRKLKNSREFPTTSQPSVGEFIQVFTAASTPGDNILGIFISSALSGTVQSARTAAEYVKDRNIIIVDSLSSSLGLGFQVLKACECVKKAKDNILQCLEEISAVRNKIKLFFLVDNLENLVRSGRLPKALGVIGGWLGIRPILTVREGRLALYDKVRCKRKGLQRLVSDFEKAAKKAIIEKVGIAHVDAAAEAESLRQMLARVYSGRIVIAEAGPAVGLHIGSGGLALIYY